MMLEARPTLWLLDHAPILGGGQLMTERLARHALARNLDVAVLCPRDSELAARCRAADVPVIHLAAPHFSDRRSFVRLPRVLGALVRLLRRSPPDTVIAVATPWLHALVLACGPLLESRPYVLLMHDQDTAARRLWRLVLRRAGPMLAIGSNATRTYRKALRREDVGVLQNFLSTGDLAAAASAPRRTRPITYQRTPRLCVVALLYAGKGVLEVIDELAASPSAWTSLDVAGGVYDADYADEVRARITRHGLEERVQLLGHIEDVHRVLDGSDVLVVPSIAREAQPTVILEGLARGLPVIVRTSIWSDDYEGLPVLAYTDATDLGERLAALPDQPADLDEVTRRFGPDRALDTVLAAAERDGS